MDISLKNFNCRKKLCAISLEYNLVNIDSKLIKISQMVSEETGYKVYIFFHTFAPSRVFS